MRLFILATRMFFHCTKGLQSIDRPLKPGWEILGFPGLGNTPKNGNTGQYWVIRFLKYVCIIVLLLHLRVRLVLESCSEGGNDMVKVN